MLDAVLNWFEIHPGLAAWVQTFGTMVALIIAIAVPWSIHRSERRKNKVDKLHQGQAIAMLIGHHLRALDGEIERAIASADKGDFAGMSIKVPQSIEAEVNQLWLMETAGGYVLHLIATLKSNKRLIETALPLLKDRSPTEITSAINLGKERLQSAREDIKNALKAMDRLLDRNI